MLTVLDATPPAGAVIGAVAGVCLILFLAAIAGTRRMRIGGADPPLLKRRLRFSYFAIAWAFLLPLAMLGLWLTGHALIAVLVLIAYAILALSFSMLVAVLRARHQDRQDRTSKVRPS